MEIQPVMARHDVHAQTRIVHQLDVMMMVLLIGNLIFTDVRDCTTKGEDDSMGKRSPRAAMAALGLLFPAHVRAIGPKSVYIMLQIGVLPSRAQGHVSIINYLHASRLRHEPLDAQAVTSTEFASPTVSLSLVPLQRQDMLMHRIDNVYRKGEEGFFNFIGGRDPVAGTDDHGRGV